MNTKTSPPSKTFDIAIVGGGFAGLTTAIALTSRLGDKVSLALVGRSGPAINDHRASALTASSRNFLSRLGLWEKIEPHATAVRHMEISDSSFEDPVRPILLHFDSAEKEEVLAHIVPNQAILDVLQRAFTKSSAVHVVHDTPTKLNIMDERISLGQDISARLIIAADGRNSAIRASSGIKLTTWSNGQSGIVATLEHSNPHNNCATQHFFHEGPFALLPLSGNRSSLVWTLPDAQAAKMMALSDTDFEIKLNQCDAQHRGTLRLASPRQSWPLKFQLARRFIAPRVALVGDAAHLIHPLAGQGMNLGFKDIETLVEVVTKIRNLGGDLGDLTALEPYEQARRADSAFIGLGMELINYSFSNANPFFRLVRGLAMISVERVPELRKRVMEIAAGTKSISN